MKNTIKREDIIVSVSFSLLFLKLNMMDYSKPCVLYDPQNLHFPLRWLRSSRLFLYGGTREKFRIIKILLTNSKHLY